MNTYAVLDKSSGLEVYRYVAAEPIEWVGCEFSSHDHVLQPAVVQPVVELPPLRVTKLDFVSRLGGDYRNILTASKSNVDIEMFVKMLDWATPDVDGTSIDMRDLRVVDAITGMEASGLLAVGRASEILNG